MFENVCEKKNSVRMILLSFLLLFKNRKKKRNCADSLNNWMWHFAELFIFIKKIDIWSICFLSLHV